MHHPGSPLIAAVRVAIVVEKLGMFLGSVLKEMMHRPLKHVQVGRTKLHCVNAQAVILGSGIERV